MIDPTLKFALIYLIWMVCAAFIVVHSAKVIYYISYRKK